MEYRDNESRGNKENAQSGRANPTPRGMIR